MKRFILVIISIISINICWGVKKGFTTTFNISGMADTTQFVVEIHDNERGLRDCRFDTIQVVNGRGVLEGVSRLSYPTQAYAGTPYGWFEFYVGNGVDEEISGTVKDIENMSLNYSGAPWSEDFIRYNRELHAPMNRLNNIAKRWKTLTQAEKDSVSAGYKNLDEKRHKMYLEYPNSWVTLRMVLFYLSRMSREDLQYIFAHLTPDRKESGFGKTLEKYLSTTTIAEGASLADYDIEGNDQNGNRFRLSDMKEPYIVVDFSQCYCGPCITATKEIAKLKDEYAGKVGFVNYSCDDTEEMWRTSVNRDNITWISVFDGTGPQGDTCLKYNVDTYPSFFIFGPDRTLIKTWSGYGPGLIKRELTELMEKPADDGAVKR